MKNSIELRPTYWASFSGGKDSLYMIYYILHNLDKYPLDGVVHFELENDYPFIKDVVDYVESELNRYGITMIRIKPRMSWMELYEKYEYPTRRVRWCNKHYKLDSDKQLKSMMKAQGKRVIYYIGFCADETKRFKVELNSREPNITQIYPLAEAGIIEADILEWAKNQPIYNDYYKYNKRCGCMCCPMSSLDNLVYTKKKYPEQYEYYMNLAAESELRLEKKCGRKISIWSSQPKYDTIYKKDRVNTIIQKESNALIETE